MKTKNKLLTLLILSASAATATAVINKYIKLSATSKNYLTDSQALCFKWRLGNIHYTKCGTGKPLLLIHDLNYASSSYEWNQIVHKLKDNYTVYTLDLLGCGRSEKPDLTYTNFLYVQLISDFIKSEIGHRTNIVVSNSSSSFVTMACNHSPELFDQIMMINPESILTCCQIPGKYAKFYNFFLNLPIIGTLLYNIASSKHMLKEAFATKYFYNPYSVKPSTIDCYYEASHLGNSPKSIFSSVECNYTKCNIVTSLKKIDNSIYIVGGAAIDGIEQLLEEYKYYNSAIEYSIIPNTKLLPHMETPGELISLIKMFFN